mmetsp:Transcript_67695/g.178284  ORF Transcript_67695/g.178284 Transcript_67695/m.178284 type:complete len:189 (+) Transcript_67695:1588-2154(+)
MPLARASSASCFMYSLVKPPDLDLLRGAVAFPKLCTLICPGPCIPNFKVEPPEGCPLALVEFNSGIACALSQSDRGITPIRKYGSTIFGEGDREDEADAPPELTLNFGERDRPIEGDREPVSASCSPRVDEVRGLVHTGGMVSPNFASDMSISKPLTVRLESAEEFNRKVCPSRPLLGRKVVCGELAD